MQGWEANFSWMIPREYGDFSHMFNKHQMRYSATEKETLAMLLALHQFEIQFNITTCGSLYRSQVGTAPSKHKRGCDIMVAHDLLWLRSEGKFLTMLTDFVNYFTNCLIKKLCGCMAEETN